jgi:NAD(P)-dependent dehydrogenase (short-subunit alcohol dehydrogenase family)
MKIALVTGGSRGLGKDMALQLARKGLAVVITYRERQADAAQVVNEIKSHGGHAAALAFDANDIAGLDGFVQRLQILLKQEWSSEGFDFLINNAGMGATVPFSNVTEDTFNHFLNVHFKSVYFLTQKCLPLLRTGGGIVNISSGSTRFCVPGYSAYASMKGAVEILTKYMAKELGARGLRCNIVAPGPIETDFNNAAIRSNPHMKSALSQMSPLGRVGNADDIGSVVAFLCTEDAKWINGQRLEVSGGINV